MGNVLPLTPNQKLLFEAILKIIFEQQTAVLDMVKAGAEKILLLTDDWIQKLVDFAGESITEEMATGYDGAGRELSVNLTPWLDHPEATNFVQEHSFTFARQVNEKTERDFQKALDEGLANGASTPELTERMREVFEGYPQENRAEMIARTESARALSAGREKGWIDSGVVQGKIWDAAGDACPFCLVMDGKVLDLGGTWFELGESLEVEFQGKTLRMDFNYEPVRYPPLHPNCRCKIRPKLMTEFSAPSTRPNPEAVLTSGSDNKFVPALSRREALDRLGENFEKVRLAEPVPILNSILNAAEQTLGAFGYQINSLGYNKVSGALGHAEYLSSNTGFMGAMVPIPDNTAMHVRFLGKFLANWKKQTDAARTNYLANKARNLKDLALEIETARAIGANTFADSLVKKMELMEGTRAWGTTHIAPDPVFALAAHEFVHILDAMSEGKFGEWVAGKLKDYNLYKGFRKEKPAIPLTDYSRVNLKEFLAELGAARLSGIEIDPRLAEAWDEGFAEFKARAELLRAQGGQ